MTQYKINTRMNADEVADTIAKHIQIPGYDIFPNSDEQTWDVYRNVCGDKKIPTDRVLSVGLEDKRIMTHNEFSLTREQVDGIRKLLVSSK